MVWDGYLENALKVLRKWEEGRGPVDEAILARERSQK